MSFSGSTIDDGSSPLAWLFSYKLDMDDREPVVTLYSSVGMYIPSIAFWTQVLLSVTLQSILSAILSIWTWYSIIQQPHSFSRFLVGYGVLIPLWLTFPRLQLEAFGIRNMVINFCLSGIIPTLNIFHTMEAMYDCVPAYAKQSLSHYTLYCGSPIMLQYDDKSEKYVKSTWRGIVRYLRNFLLFSFLTGMMQSLLTPYQYQPLYQATTQWYDFSRILQLGQLGNNILHALLFQLYIMSFCEGLMALTAIVFGKQPETVMENPVLKSTTPSEFWGQRWNKLIHGVLKRGVYIPARKANLPKFVAVLATFLASSLFHEWILTNLFYKVEHHEYIPDLGGSTAFLLWNGLLLIGESLLYNLSIFQWMQQNLPKPVRTLLLIMLAVPFAHLFCDAYVHSDFFRHGQLAFPMLKTVEVDTVTSS